MSEVASRYAESLLILAKEKDVVERYKDEIILISNAFDDANIKKFFASCKINKEEKKELIKKVLNDTVDKYVLNFLFVLIDKNRIVYYQDIFKEFIKLANNELNIVEGSIELARDIDEKLLHELEEALSYDNKRIILKVKISDDVISGFRINLDNKIIDNTMKKRIEDLENALLRKGGLWT